MKETIVLLILLISSAFSAPLRIEGTVESIRKNSVGIAYGPPGNSIVAEAIIKLKEYPDRAFGIRLDTSSVNIEANRAKLKVIEDAYIGDIPITISYAKAGIDKGMIIAVTVSPYAAIVPPPATVPLLVILFNPNSPGMDTFPAHTIKPLLDGSVGSVCDYYKSVSDGKFTFEIADILGWYEGDSTWTHYQGVDKPENLRREAVIKASATFDFAQYDHNSDGILDPYSELAVLIVEPDITTSYHGAGWNRYFSPQLLVDDKQVKKVAHVRLSARSIAEDTVRSEMRGALGLTAHELFHLSLVENSDLYFSSYATPFEVESYGLMDNHWRHPHLNPYWKSKLGWLREKESRTGGIFELRDVTQSKEVLKLVNPERGKQEYFLIENRYAGNPQSYDRGLPDEGLAVWHIKESLPGKGLIVPDVILESNPPALEETIKAHWEKANKVRRGIRLIRPVLDTIHSDSLDLWDGNKAAVQSALPYELFWADGSSSGFIIVDVSSAGEDMAIQIKMKE